MNTTNRLIGPAGKLADTFARTIEDADRVKILFSGLPGVGKTALADRIAENLCGGRFSVESVNGRKCSIHVVAEWQRLCATSSMFGTGWRAFVINEVDTCPADAQDLLLTFLDEMPVNCAFIATSNLELDKLTPRFSSRLDRREVGAPSPEEVAVLLCHDHGVPALVAQQIAFLCSGNVRAALIDAAAWREPRRFAVTPGAAMTAVTEFDHAMNTKPQIQTDQESARYMVLTRWGAAKSIDGADYAWLAERFPGGRADEMTAIEMALRIAGLWDRYVADGEPKWKAFRDWILKVVPAPTSSLFAEIKAAGIPYSNHESDLYFERSEKSLEILGRHPTELRNARPFVNQARPHVGETWIDVPFAFVPWWEARSATL